MDKGKRNRFFAVGLSILAGSLLFCSGMTVGAATNEPGSAGDPLITRSYLEKELRGLSVGYECLTLAKGEKLELCQGTQIILYTGSATVLGSVVDTTEGTLTGAGERAVKYHTYLAPADKSGFTADTTCVIFLSGEKY